MKPLSPLSPLSPLWDGERQKAKVLCPLTPWGYRLNPLGLLPKPLGLIGNTPRV